MQKKISVGIADMKLTRQEGLHMRWVHVSELPFMIQ